MAMKQGELLPAVVPELFEHEQFGQFRYIKRGEEIWFAAIDLCRVLGYKNGSRDVNRHVDKDDQKIITRKQWEQMASNQESTVSVPFFSDEDMGGTQRLILVNEAGMYSLIFGSQLPAAKKFKRWVTHEVLPAIRKYGFYGLLNGTQIKQLPIKEYVHYLGQLTPEQYENYLRQLTTEQGQEHYKRLKENLSNMTQEEIKALAKDPDIIVSRIGHGNWKAEFFC